MNKRILVPAIAAIGLFGCSDDITKEYNSNSETVVQEVDLEGTLQGAIYNAHTGVRIGGEDLQVYLIQGTDHREPTELITDTASVLKGEYSFDQIPVTHSSILNSTFKLVVYKPGYQVFESEFSFTAEYEYMLDTNNIKSIDGNVYTEDLTNLLMHEAVINKIGNVYLYPEAMEAQDVEIAAFANGHFLPGMPVTLRRLSNWEGLGPTTTTVASPTDGDGAGRDTRLYSTTGRFDVITKVTNAQGIATFSSEELVLGARYQAIVGPGEEDHIRYVATKGVVFEAGVSGSSGFQEIVMDEAVGAMPLVEIEEVVKDDATGKLTLTLSRPVLLQNTRGLDAALNLNGSTNIRVTRVTAAVTNNGMTITITPTFDRDLEPGDDFTITYSSTQNNPLTYTTVNYIGSDDPIEVIDLDGGDWVVTMDVN